MVDHINSTATTTSAATVHHCSRCVPDQPEPVFAVYQSRRNLSSRFKVFLKFLEERVVEPLEWKVDR